MDYADFVHLARTSEQDCAHDSRAYRRSVIRFAALGYLWVIGCVVVALALLAFSVHQLMNVRFGFVWISLIFAACGLLWVGLKALRVPTEPPVGVRVTPEDAPELFQSLARIQKRIKGPPIHEVYLDDEFNAGVRQVPRFGVLGGSVNQLMIGLPMLMALDKRRMLVVLAHEYGHLRGDHGKLGSWIYRTRKSWMRLYESMEDSASPFAVATQAFLRWYSPRFVARTFAMARQNEYEADRLAAKLIGREEAVAELVESRVKGQWLHTRFWNLHWAQAVREPLPVGPYKAMQRLLVQIPDQNFAQDALRSGLGHLSSVDDTHPVLRERLAALSKDKERPRLPEQWSERGSLELLGASAARWIDQFDREWCKDNADGWKRHHAWLQRARTRVMELQANAANNSVADLVEMAQLIKRLNPASSMSVELYRKALDRDPVQPQALIGKALHMVETDPERCLQYLERLWNHHPAHRLWSARMAVQELETKREGREFPEQALKQWRERRREAENAEAEVMQELNRSGILESVQAHELSAFELAELQAELARIHPVRQAWLLRKKIACMPDRRAHVLLVALARTEDAAKQQLCSEIGERIDLGGMAWVVPWDQAGSKEQLLSVAGQPVFVRE
ncbi:M48 family metallopeptidase [Diaphorobacter caeni]|uniref:M48 family metallopeptidase n=1 Tax=Diaphorobacter caeni TaxID=2784387 RepID=UPI001890AF0A|nr:M48 family metallopeptidase [Diaphorobacter caeni]MBF5003767.1 M48 family metalloprotease [Diaphorobacter caeni]